VSGPAVRTGLAALVAWTLANLLAPSAAGDGGTIRLVEPAGPFVVAVFTAPEPLRAGVADVSVLVLDRAAGQPLLDASVALEATPPPGSDAQPVRLDATHAQATNKLLYAAPLTLAVVGDWSLRVTVRHDAGAADLTCVLPVAARGPALAGIWPFLTIPPVVIALYVLHAWLSRRRQR